MPAPTRSPGTQLSSDFIKQTSKSQPLDEISQLQVIALVPPPIKAAGHHKSQLLSEPSRSDRRQLVPPSVSTMAGQATTSRSTTHYNATEACQFKLSKFSEKFIQQCVESKLLREEVVISTNLHRIGFRRDRTTGGLDISAQNTLSDIVRAQRLDVAAAARLVRGQSLWILVQTRP